MSGREGRADHEVRRTPPLARQQATDTDVNSGTTPEIQTLARAVDFAMLVPTNGNLVLDDPKISPGRSSASGEGRLTNADAIAVKDIHFATATETYTENRPARAHTHNQRGRRTRPTSISAGKYTLAISKFYRRGSGWRS